MAQPTIVDIQRQAINQPWGFRLSGGKDFRMQLQVKKVSLFQKMLSSQFRRVTEILF